MQTIQPSNPSPRLRLFLGILILCCGSDTVFALIPEPNDPAVVYLMVPYGSTRFPVPKESLVGDGGSAVQLISQPSLGVLEPQGGGFVFWPSASFWREGIDLFRFEHSGLEDPAVAFLISDQKVLLLGTPENKHVYVGDRTPEGGNVDFELGGGNASGQNSGGSYPLSGSLQELGFAADDEDYRIFRVIYSDALGGAELRVRALDENEDTRVLSVPLESSEIVSLRWWIETPPGACNGGLWVLIDGTFAGALTNLCNANHDVLLWDFENGDKIGKVGELEVWGSPHTPAFPPALGDGFETGDLSVWTEDAPAGALQASPAAAIFGGHGLRVEIAGGGEPAALISPEISGGSYHRSSLRLRLPTAGGLSGTVTVMRALDEVGEEIYRVELDTEVEARLRAVVADRDGPHILPWLSLPTVRGGAAIEIQWWASSQGEEGGFALEVGGERRSLRSLHTRAPTVHSLAVGALAIGVGTYGTFHLDELYVWQ